MQCLGELEIDGIAYTSKKVNNTSIGYPQCVNLAIPMKSGEKLEIDSESDKYGDICKSVYLSNPLNLSEYLKVNRPDLFTEKRSYLNLCFNDGFSSNIELANKYIPYQDTIFSKFDDYLCSLEHKRADIFEEGYSKLLK